MPQQYGGGMANAPVANRMPQVRMGMETLAKVLDEQRSALERLEVRLSGVSSPLATAVAPLKGLAPSEAGPGMAPLAQEIHNLVGQIEDATRRINNMTDCLEV